MPDATKRSKGNKARVARDDFRKTAEERIVNTIASGEVIPWAEMRRYLEDRAAGRSAVRPAAKKLAR